MLKKNYLYLSFNVIVTVYNAVQLIFYPELTPIWFIRVIGGLFIIYAIEYLLDIQKLYLQNKINKIEELISAKTLKTEN